MYVLKTPKQASGTAQRHSTCLTCVSGLPAPHITQTRGKNSSRVGWGGGVGGGGGHCTLMGFLLWRKEFSSDKPQVVNFVDFACCCCSLFWFFGNLSLIQTVIIVFLWSKTILKQVLAEHEGPFQTGSTLSDSQMELLIQKCQCQGAKGFRELSKVAEEAGLTL